LAPIFMDCIGFAGVLPGIWTYKGTIYHDIINCYIYINTFFVKPRINGKHVF